MNYRTTTVLARSDLGASGTKVIDINLTDPVSKFIFKIEATVVNTPWIAHLLDCVSKIELVDGSDVLESLSAFQMNGLHFLETGELANSQVEAFYDTTVEGYTAMLFGRFMHDPELAFDPTKFRNPQLKITHNLAVSDTGVSAAWLEVWAECFDEKIVTPVGFLMSKEYHSWSITAADTYHYVDLPTDYPIRKMLIQGYAKGVEPWYQVAQARLDEENEKRIPFDWDLEDYYRTMKGSWTPVEDRIYAYEETTGIYAYYLTPSNYYGNWAGAAVGTDAPSCLTGAATGGLFTLRTDTLSSVSGIASGYLPNHCFEFPFGDQMDLADWYDVTKLGNLRLRLKSGSATSGSGNVILQQLRRY